MNNTIDNLVEVIEENDTFMRILDQRTSKIGEFKGLGPPDLCYFVREEKGGIFSASKKAGYFHYVYGADTSSPATVAAYINDTLKQGPNDFWSAKSKLKVVKAIFCIYNHRDLQDIRLEINFPGKMDVYGISKSSVKASINEALWMRTYVLSVLRSFSPQFSTSVRILPELSTRVQLKYFIQSSLTLIKHGIKFDKVTDVMKTTSNYLAGKIIRYLLSKSKFEDCKEFIECLIAEDEKYVGFLPKALMEIGSIQESLFFTAHKIKETPQDAVLLYHQAKALFQLNLNNYALILAKYACELAPESTSAWVLLAQSYIASGNLKHALLAIDTAPVYSNETGNDVSHEKYVGGLPRTKPKKVQEADCCGKIMVPPTNLDFEISVHGGQMEFKTINKREDEEQMSLLGQLGANRFSESEKEVYHALASIEKQVGWDALIQLRDQLFVKGQANDWDNPKVAAECPRPEGKTDRLHKDTVSLEVIRRLGKRAINPTESEKKATGKGEMSPSVIIKSLIKEKAEVLETPEALIISSPADVHDKRVCEKLDDMLNALNDDLYAYYYWEDEETSNSEKLSTLLLYNHLQLAHKYRGKVWLYRGIVAERLNRIRMAERAYQRVIEKGYSLYAWGRLLDIYATANNVKAAFECIWEILEYFSAALGVSSYKSLPGWLENTIFKLISKNGLEEVKKVAFKEKMKRFKGIEDCLAKAKNEYVYEPKLL